MFPSVLRLVSKAAPSGAGMRERREGRRLAFLARARYQRGVSFSRLNHAR